MTSGTWTYTLDNNNPAVQALDVGEILSDTYTFVASDGSSQQVTVTINGAEDAPVFDSTAVTAATEDLAYSYTITTSDVDVEAVTITAPTLPAWLTFVDNGDGTATLSGTPSNAEVGSHNVVLNVSDGTLSSNQSFTIVVGNTNDPAVIAGVDTGSVQEDVGVVANNISTTGTLTIADPDTGESTFQAATINGTYGDLAIDIAGNWTYTADNTQAAIQQLDSLESITDTLTVTSFDGTTHNVVITINGSEDAAQISGTTTGSVTEDGTLTSSGALTITDTDTSDTPSFADVGVTAGANGYGTFEMTAGTWTYTLDNNNAAVQALDTGETLSDTYTFTATDGSSQLVTVTINGAEDAPVLGGVNTGTVTEDGALTASNGLTITDVDSSDNPISYNDVAPTPGSNGYGNFEISGNTWTYTLNNSHTTVQGLDVGESLTDSFTFTASDGSTQVVSITINGAEDAPTLDNPVADQIATESVAFNYIFAADSFSDLDASDTLTYTASLSDNSPLPGWLVFDGATRTFSGTPGAGDVGTIDIKITADDGSSAVTDIFTLTVDPFNNAPVIGGTDLGSVTEDQDVVGNTISASGALTIADPDAGESSFVDGTINGAFGSLTIDAAGNWSYSADNGNPEIQALQAGDRIIETLTVTTADGSTHDIEIVINGAREAAPPPVVEPPVVEPPPEEEPPREEEVVEDDSTGSTEQILEEITPIVQGSAPPPALEIVSSNDVIEEEQSEQLDKASFQQQAMEPNAELRPAQPLQNNALDVDKLSLQVSDDEALNEKFELELLDRIDQMHQGMDNEVYRNANDVEVQIVMGSTATITAGIVSWVLRGGSLLASLMGTVPLLNRFDPLPILKSREDEEDVEEDDDDDTDDTESQARQHARRVDNLFSGKQDARQRSGFVDE
jgi:VCBS repeat-containing protein